MGLAVYAEDTMCISIAFVVVQVPTGITQSDFKHKVTTTLCMIPTNNDTLKLLLS